MHSVCNLLYSESRYAATAAKCYSVQLRTYMGVELLLFFHSHDLTRTYFPEMSWVLPWECSRPKSGIIRSAINRWSDCIGQDRYSHHLQDLYPSCIVKKRFAQNCLTINFITPFFDSAQLDLRLWCRKKNRLRQTETKKVFTVFLIICFLRFITFVDVELF